MNKRSRSKINTLVKIILVTQEAFGTTSNRHLTNAINPFHFTIKLLYIKAKLSIRTETFFQ